MLMATCGLPQVMELHGYEPSVQLLERCLERSEREGDAGAITRVMEALELQAYKIIGAASKVPVRQQWLGNPESCLESLV